MEFNLVISFGLSKSLIIAIISMVGFAINPLTDVDPI